MNSNTLLKLISEAEYIKEEENHTYDELYIIPKITLHDSNYHFLEIYGKKYNDKEDKLYILSKCSDVIHFENINEHSWFCSLDVPYYGITRIFCRRNYNFLIPFYNISDFTIEFKEKE